MEIKFVWLDDCSGVYHSCHRNGPGSRSETFIGEVRWVTSKDSVGLGRWVAKVKDLEQGFTTQTAAKQFVQSTGVTK
jgi:hypothetical protein